MKCFIWVLHYITHGYLSVVEVSTDQSHVNSNPGDNVSQCKHTYVH